MYVGCECVTVQAAAVLMLISALLGVYSGVHIAYDGVAVQAAAAATAVAVVRVTTVCSCNHPFL
jgi:hypothetical protein